MRKMLVPAVCFLLLTAAAAHAEVKIAVFNVEKVALECDAYKEGEKAMKRDFDGRKNALDAEKTVLTGKVTAARTAGATKAQQDEVVKLGEAYNQKNRDFVNEYEKALRRIRSDIELIIHEAAAQYAREKGYNLIMDTMLVEHSNFPDITADMLSKTNAVWRGMR